MLAESKRVKVFVKDTEKDITLTTGPNVIKFLMSVIYEYLL